MPRETLAFSCLPFQWPLICNLHRVGSYKPVDQAIVELNNPLFLIFTKVNPYYFITLSSPIIRFLLAWNLSLRPSPISPLTVLPISLHLKLDLLDENKFCNDIESIGHAKKPTIQTWTQKSKTTTLSQKQYFHLPLPQSRPYLSMFLGRIQSCFWPKFSTRSQKYHQFRASYMI